MDFFVDERSTCMKLMHKINTLEPIISVYVCGLGMSMMHMHILYMRAREAMCASKSHRSRVCVSEWAHTCVFDARSGCVYCYIYVFMGTYVRVCIWILTQPGHG